ncbi:inhibitor of apoptosis-like protein [Leptotrombidium deliense]|uniref:Inhibitor of apoptosis-like protein n=1 Tax=Leptotrombidium deliense TaxID=299467 RepID=A0A443SFR7_9ACAR|nr:inhibitor of apoptosis-like protein [Leptotrombidium deliense]
MSLNRQKGFVKANEYKTIKLDPPSHAFQKKYRLGVEISKIWKFVDISDNDRKEMLSELIRPPSMNAKVLYKTSDVRRRTFVTWQEAYLRTEDMANAGLYYTGVGDAVRCFSCNGLLFDWQLDDDPAARHAQQYPLCEQTAAAAVPKINKTECVY